MRYTAFHTTPKQHKRFSFFPYASYAVSHKSGESHDCGNLIGKNERKNHSDATSTMMMAVWTTYLRNDIEIERAGSGCITIEWIHVSVDVCNKNRHLLISAQRKFFLWTFANGIKSGRSIKKNMRHFIVVPCVGVRALWMESTSESMASESCVEILSHSASTLLSYTIGICLCKLNATDQQWPFVHSLNGFKDSISN